MKETLMVDAPLPRLQRFGAAALSVGELLTLVMVNEASARGALEASGGSLRKLARMGQAQLEALPFVGPTTAARVRAAMELGRRMATEGPHQRVRFGAPGDVYDLLAPRLRDLDHEEFHVLLLNTQHCLLADVLVTIGVLDGSIVHPREVFRAAIAEAAAAIIIVHNHPSGDPSPSPEDRSITRQIVQAGTVIGIPVIDHVVIGDGRYVSFVEAGLMESAT